ncbi:sulfotransferase family protein [Motilibacter aurantiacus]|uniref:hypothetical protein n=1 Tax=Motilibacter aurantiacus TaxID=2714955 RepID=UPI00140803FF|nr:hypothetical protein [Motilibacter aurantiacus]NHC45182.1 hypothetical protein [Motilibacter aurantiacus]
MPQPLVLLSAGGYRSGSTLLYNLLGEYVELANTGRRIGYVEPGQVPLLAGPAWSFVEAMGVAVGKAHHTPAIPEGGDWSPLLDGRLLPVCTVRDWRDVLHSFSRAFGQPPAEVLASRRWRVNLDNVRWWRDSGAVMVGYERLLTAPEDVLVEVAAAAGMAVDPGAAVRACAAAGADGAGGVPGTTVAPLSTDADRRTLMHEGHVCTPHGGGWRQWDAATLASVDAVLAPLAEEFATAPDGAAAPAACAGAGARGA